MSQTPAIHADVPPATATEAPALISVLQVAHLLSCSTRHVYRLCDAGRMPRPVRLGVLVRWNRQVVERWIAEGCPEVREPRSSGGSR